MLIGCAAKVSKPLGDNERIPLQSQFNVALNTWTALLQSTRSRFVT